MSSVLKQQHPVNLLLLFDSCFNIGFHFVFCLNQQPPERQETP